jgi:hypothetical protein
MIPVIWIKNDLYLVGSQKVTCQLKSGNVLIKVGASFEFFDQVVPSTQKYHQKVLVTHMISNDESLEWVCDQLIQNKRIVAKNNVTSNIKLDRPFLGKSPERQNAKKGIQVSQRSMNQSALSPIRIFKK